MEKNSSFAIYGVLGYPAKHSLSPKMHNAAFQELGINATYNIFEKKPEELEEFIRTLFLHNIHGINVTVPYKESVMPYLTKVSSEARLIGAVNTIKVSYDKLEGFNTDGEGFLDHLRRDLGFMPTGKNVAIIGAGGAARAIAVYLSRIKPRFMSIYDIDKVRLKELILYLKEKFGTTGYIMADSIEELNIGYCNLLVNATPIGMKDSDPCLVDEKLFHKNLLVYDLIYKPSETKLLKAAREKGAKVSNGLGMLLYQGMLSFQIWTGKPAPKESMRQALSSAL